MPYVKGVGYVPSDRTVRAEQTKTECLEALKRLAAELGRTPMTVDVNQSAYISRRDFVNGALLASAGLLFHRRGGRVRGQRAREGNHRGRRERQRFVAPR